MNFLDHLRAQWFAALFGCILYVAAITILFWNEVRRSYLYAISGWWLIYVTYISGKSGK